MPTTTRVIVLSPSLLIACCAVCLSQRFPEGSQHGILPSEERCPPPRARVVHHGATPALPPPARCFRQLSGGRKRRLFHWHPGLFQRLEIGAKSVCGGREA